MKSPSQTWMFSLLSCALAASAEAQATWVQTPTAVAPSPRYLHAAAYDVSRGRLVMFGGRSSSGQTTNDTWELIGATWGQRTPALSPTPRNCHWMAYDPGRARVVLFGGSTNGGASSGAVADTWEWNGTNWTQRLSVQSPAPRVYHAMTTDWVNNRVVLFGGQDSTGTDLNDTWAWDGTNWAQIATTGPSPRSVIDLVQDIARARIVLFGGQHHQQGPVAPLGDTWEFDGMAWQQMQPAISPSARWGHRMSYDPVLNQLILRGGSHGSTETWRWNGATWTLLNTSVSRTLHVMSHDWQVGRATTFGGWDPLVPDSVDTTWTFGIAAPATVTPFGSACPGTMGTPQLAMQAPNPPSIGRTITLQVMPASSFLLFVCGWSNTVSGSTALPYSLAPHGAPGCSVLVSSEGVFAANGWAPTMTVALPFAPSLVGVQFFNQAVLFDAGANPLGLTTSNGLRLTIGWQ